MYSEWASLSHGSSGGGVDGRGESEEESQSVLWRFPPQSARDVVCAVVRQLASSLGLSASQAEGGGIPPLATDREVSWCMEVVCYGLGLPLSDHEVIRDCVSIYCDWLSALGPQPKPCVPQPIVRDPNFYSRRIVAHFYNLFVPRKGEGADTINRQAVLCHRVLRTLQSVAQASTTMSGETWESLLLFLLSINEALLAPPTVKDDVGDQLCERVLSVLFEIWLLACANSFPTPPLWKTFREMCMNWRHRSVLVDQWNRVNLALTSKLLQVMYGPTFPELRTAPFPSEDPPLVPPGMSAECVAQSWFRFLHCLGSPVDLVNPALVSQTQKFLQFALMSETVVDPCQHPCLGQLPDIFCRAMKGIATLADAFLGLPRAALISLTSRSSMSHSQSGSASGPPSTSSIASSSPPSLGPESISRPPLAPARPKCNSILHLFGSWLFEAVLIGCEFSGPLKMTHHKSEGSAPRRPSSMLLDGRKAALGSQPTALADSVEIPPSLSMDKYESGRAQALGALCRVFCAKKTGEEILPAYLARFYLAVQQGLRGTQPKVCTEMMASVLLNSSDLLRIDLDGVQILVPHVVSALETVLPDKDVELRSQNVSRTELRRASIHLLLSMLALPLHFQNLPIKEFSGSPAFDSKGEPTNKTSDSPRQPVTFAQLKPRLVNLLINSLQVESDSYNTQMLLGGLLLCVQDSAAFEEVDQVTQADDLTGPTSDSPANLLSSDSAHALFVRSTYLVCHRLISSWQSELNVSLAALELLAGLSKARLEENQWLESKRAVKWLCDYVAHQCSRPPPAHSRDLHSSIVAALSCAGSWLLAHPYLLQDPESLGTVLEALELGLSGSKSQGKPSQPLRLKHLKEMKPASLRVRDAAEALLALLLEQVGYFPSPCGPESLSTRLDEASLLRLCDSQSRRFHYFVSENSVLLALLEEPLGNDQDPQPTVTVLLRGPFGRHAWTMQMRHLPRHKSGSRFHASNPGRPLPVTDIGVQNEVRPRYFPESVERIPVCKVDKSIPPVEATLNQLDETLGRMVDQASVAESALNETGLSEYPNLETECRPPPVCQEFQTARLFLSHFGLLSLEALKETLDSPVPSLVALDSTQQGFVKDLEALDTLSPRTCDTVHLFYVRAGQRTASEILSNVESKQDVHPHFLEFVRSLGWPVDVYRHPGWTGHVRTSWKVKEAPENAAHNPDHGGSVYNGDAHALYWADASSEIAFIVPTRVQCEENEGKPLTDSWRRRGNSDATATCEAKVLVVWLESYEDNSTLPLDEMAQKTSTGLDAVQPTARDCLVISVHSLQSGLFRVKLQGPSGRMTLATPLVDGMVVSRRVLGSLVRQTALNMCRRRRLESENYQPPHVRRKLRVQEMVQKYRCKLTESEFYTALFQNKGG